MVGCCINIIFYLWANVVFDIHNSPKTKPEPSHQFLLYNRVFNCHIICIGLSRYIAIANLSITAVFVEYLRQFLIDLN